MKGTRKKGKRQKQAVYSFRVQSINFGIGIAKKKKKKETAPNLIVRKR